MALSVATDAQGNAYVAGTFSNDAITFGNITLQLNGYASVFLVKFSPEGQVLWAKGYGGPYDDGPLDFTGNSVAVDRYGYIYTTGQIQSPFLHLAGTTFQNPSVSMYLAKFDSNGNALWLKGAVGAIGNCLATDPDGNIYLSGRYGDTLTLDTVFITGQDTFANIFIAKYDTAGHVKWARSVGSSLTANHNDLMVNTAIATDKFENVYATGSYNQPQATIGNTTLTNPWSGQGSVAVFIAKYDSAGKVLWANGAAGQFSAFAYGVSTDPEGNAYFTGGFADSATNSTQQVTPADTLIFGDYIITSSAAEASPMFIVKYSPEGNVLCASSLPSGGVEKNTVVTDTAGNTYYVGFGASAEVLGDSSYPANLYGYPLIAQYICNKNDTLIDTASTQCKAFFTAAPQTGDTGVYIVQDLSTGNSLKYLWDFGDGDTSSLQYPVHKYDSSGYYNVCLTVYHDTCSSTFCDSNFYAYKYGFPMSELIVANPAGITQIQGDQAVSIFPNPTTNKIFMVTSNFHPTEIAFYDMEGRRNLLLPYMPEMDISPLSAGVYLVEINGAEGNIMKKLIKF